jgi:hypothetical protein
MSSIASRMSSGMIRFGSVGGLSSIVITSGENVGGGCSGDGVRGACDGKPCIEWGGMPSLCRRKPGSTSDRRRKAASSTRLHCAARSAAAAAAALLLSAASRAAASSAGVRGCRRGSEGSSSPRVGRGADVVEGTRGAPAEDLGRVGGQRGVAVEGCRCWGCGGERGCLV